MTLPWRLHAWEISIGRITERWRHSSPGSCRPCEFGNIATRAELLSYSRQPTLNIRAHLVAASQFHRSSTPNASSRTRYIYPNIFHKDWITFQTSSQLPSITFFCSFLSCFSPPYR